MATRPAYSRKTEGWAACATKLAQTVPQGDSFYLCFPARVGFCSACCRRYVRYQFAGRTFEETFQDTQEVELPSPSSTYLGNTDVR